ncbi:hypothetical protein GOODEAATRI_014279 [Goodea atripinnis]|uniref:Uncharacterized protein n=1 Tax=Goodea atripinnis TaxID=208336 RepID=A0ABV0P5K1_9TELE
MSLDSRGGFAISTHCCCTAQPTVYYTGYDLVHTQSCLQLTSSQGYFVLGLQGIPDCLQDATEPWFNQINHQLAATWLPPPRSSPNEPCPPSTALHDLRLVQALQSQAPYSKVS